MATDQMEQDQSPVSEYEPFDTEKEKYIDEQLMERFHMNVEVTTHLRKTCPPQIKTKLKKIYRHEWKHICRSQTNAANSKTESENDCQPNNLLNDCQDTINQDQIDERLGACSQKVEDVNANVKDVLTKTKELIKSSEMCQRFKCSESYKLVYETPPSTPEKINTDTQCSSNMLHNKCIISSELNI